MSTDEQVTLPTPIMLRARITGEEWANIRKLAIDDKVSNVDLMADIVRRGLASYMADRATA